MEYLQLAIWAVFLAMALMRSARYPRLTGISLAWWLNLALYHLVTGVVGMVGQVETPRSLHSEIGFSVAAWAAAGGAVGLVLPLYAAPLFAMPRRWLRGAPKVHGQSMEWSRYVLLVGVLLFGVHWLGSAGLGAVVPTGMVTLGIPLISAAALVRYSEYQERGQKFLAWLYLTPAVLLPAITGIARGFVALGLVGTVAVAAFVMVRTRRWVAVSLLPVAGYAGLTLWVSYLPFRTDLRNQIDASVQVAERTSFITESADRHGRLFDPSDATQVGMLERFDQNYLIGLADERIEVGMIEPYWGSTMRNAVIAFVPRAIWPDKPVITGGSELASEATGLRFWGDTSIGVGPVMEFDINFGRWGVFVLFVLFGIAVGLLDEAATAALATGRWEVFYRTFLWGTLLTQPLPDFAATVGQLVAGYVAILVVRSVLFLMGSARARGGAMAGDMGRVRLRWAGRGQ